MLYWQESGLHNTVPVNSGRICLIIAHPRPDYSSLSYSLTLVKPTLTDPSLTGQPAVLVLIDVWTLG
jgi:hypothetical protein